MIKNYLMIALRHVVRSRVYAFINLFGLGLGMACAILVFRYVLYELSYDTYPERADRIYRVEQTFTGRHGEAVRSALTPGPLADVLRRKIPEIEQTVRLFTYSWKETALVAHGEQRAYEEHVFLADPGVLEVFTRPFVYGDAATALQDPGGIILSASAAQRYFGDADPIGKQLTITLYEPYDFHVTGVVEDIPPNAHFRADFIAPIASGARMFWDDFGEAWRSNDFYTYVVLAEGHTPDALSSTLQQVARMHPDAGETTLQLRALRDIHLHSHLRDEIAPNGDVRTLYFFVLLALGILGIAAVNYVNLSVARSLPRAREIGIRKVVGAQRPQLIRQFLGESVLLALLALPVALLLADVLLPAFHVLTDSPLPPGLHKNLPVLLLIGLGVAAATGLLAGLYPAFFLSAFRPTTILKGTPKLGTGRSWSRSALIVFQFATAIVFVVGTLVVGRQMRLIQQKDLGFDEEAIMVLPLKDDASRQRFDVLRHTLLENAAVTHVAATTFLPGHNRRSYSDVVADGARHDDEQLARWNSVSPDFLATFGLDLVAGRPLAEALETEATGAFLVNETAARHFGWEEPLGKTLTLDMEARVPRTGTVVGVVKDFHFASLHQPIEPLILYVAPERYEYVAANVQAGRLAEGVDALRAAWQRINPDQPFDYTFLDVHLDAVYRQDARTGTLFQYATLLAIALACLGLFGLAALTTAQRTKEIGVRKVLGATAAHIVVLLAKDFARLVVLALMVATPVAYVLMERWLDGFAYRINLSWRIFLIAGLAVVGVAFLTVSYQAIKAARTDPVESLRHE